MKKSLLIEEVAHKSGISNENVKLIIDNALDVIIDSLKSGEGVSFKGFGSFQVNRVKPRYLFIPGTSKKIVVKNLNRIRFIPSNVLKDKLNED